MQPINLQFRYFRAEYMQAARVHFASRLRLPLDITAVVLLAFLGSYLWRTEEQSTYGLLLVSLDAAFAIFLILAFTLLPYLLFRNQPALKEEYRLTFSEKKIHFKTIHLDSTLRWSIYNRALVSTNFFLLYNGARSFSVLPKRVFASLEQQESFEEMMLQNIPNIACLTWRGTNGPRTHG